jgi:glycosyltransferase involved in cell wall biosynthesis
MQLTRVYWRIPTHMLARSSCIDVRKLDLLDEVCLVGHPFAPTGRGEDVRCMLRSLRAIGASPHVLDIYRLSPRTDPSIAADLNAAQTDKLSSRLNIFLINGDEVSQAIAHLGGLPKSAINIVYPAWELPNYPATWARELERFDEVWAPSRFIADAISPSVSTPVVHMPLACEPKMQTFLGRSHFGIPESAIAFLYYFDFTSFVARKNPLAVIAAFEKALERSRACDARLVLKLNNGHLAAEDYARFKNELKERHLDIILLDKTLTDNEIKNLIRCCDAFVSLHRSEGFGRGLAEAMALGKPVISTAWSGNLDFMNSDVACLVKYRLIPVRDNDYPFWRGQVWAEPDVDDAAEHMVQIMHSRQMAAELGGRASRHLRVHFSYRARGLSSASRILDCLGGEAFTNVAETSDRLLEDDKTH